ncbi:MAG: TonB family protein [Ignavibacteriales bacterium]|nr:TonB family protein [Ignavibacteriales bacterium]
MTAQAMVANIKSGMQDWRNLYKRHLGIALTIAISFHLLAIGSYYLAGYLSEEDEPVVMVRITKYTDLGPPPSMTEAEIAPAVAVNVPVAKPTVGIPVAVPDAEVSPEQTIATQQELSQIQSPVVQQQDDGQVQIEQDINITDEEPPDFVPVEKQPVPVKQVQPDYPEIARRAGVEGTVWVKILVDKEGKAKKAVVMKSDAEIFNEPAQKAAMQWVFTPAMMNNGPVAVWAAVPFRFKLNK